MALIIGTDGRDNITAWGASAGVTGGPATAGDDTVLGLAGDDHLSGGAGNDFIDGGAGGGIQNGDHGDDTLVGGSDGDTIQDTAGNDSMWGGGGNDILLDWNGTNTLRGGDGDDTLSHGSYVAGSLLDGGDGDDLISVYGTAMTTLTGGAGADHFSFSAAVAYGTGGAMVVTDFEAGSGGDRIDVTDWLANSVGDFRGNPFASGHLRLRQDGADLLLEWDRDGNGADYAFATALRLLDTPSSLMTAANFEPGFDPAGTVLPGSLIVGTEGADAINAQASSAGVTGGLATGADDTIRGLGGRDTLYGGIGDDLLEGGAGDDQLDGQGGDDTLIGGEGSDRLVGGFGDDLFIVGEGDIVAEGPGPWMDTVRTALAAYVLPVDVEVLVATSAIAHDFTGNNGDNAIIGHARADALRGAAGADTLTGAGGNDTLDGGAGADRLAGGGGNDLYLVDAGDVVVEAANLGADTVHTGLATYALTPHVEVLVAITASAHRFVGNAQDNAIIGHAGADTLFGGDGNDTLDGAAGIDRLIGGPGDDRYVVTVADIVLEAVNQGIDTVEVAHGGSYTLAANVENAVFTGGAAVNGIGNGLANALTGNGAVNVLYGLGGADTLAGEDGNDILIGGAGGDRLSGGSGSDQFRLIAASESSIAAPDLIADFTFLRGVELDRIDLRLIDANVAQPGDQAFVYRGVGFTGVAGDLRVQADGTGRYAVAGDVNGDAVADFAIVVVTAATPEAAWFLL